MSALLHQVWDSFISGTKLPLAIVVFGMGPLFVAGWFLHRRKKRYKAEATEPFTRLPLRPAGESLRLKIDELSENFDDALTSLALANVFAVALTATAQPGKHLFTGVVCGLLVAGAYLRYLPRLFKTARRLWDYRLGYKGERIVGEELNQLLAHGFRVFHDVPPLMDITSITCSLVRRAFLQLKQKPAANPPILPGVKKPSLSSTE